VRPSAGQESPIASFRKQISYTHAVGEKPPRLMSLGFAIISMFSSPLELTKTAGSFRVFIPPMLASTDGVCLNA